MNEITTKVETLPRLIEQASAALSKATTAAEFLEAGRMAATTYKVAKEFARFKNAHDTVLAACRKAMGDAIVIEEQATCRLADEYDAAQDRGEIPKKGGDRKSKIKLSKEKSDRAINSIGLTDAKIHQARIMRDAEKANPGFVRKLVDEQVLAGKEPTKAAVKRAISKPKARGSKPQQRKTTPAEDKLIAEAYLDQNMGYAEVEKKFGVSNTVVRRAVANEQESAAGALSIAPICRCRHSKSSMRR